MAALIKWGGLAQGIESGGIYVIECAGAYLLGRVFIRSCEDFAAMAGVQRGLASGVLDKVRIGANEPALGVVRERQAPEEVRLGHLHAPCREHVARRPALAGERACLRRPLEIQPDARRERTKPVAAVDSG